jgi:hypothetical protein
VIGTTGTTVLVVVNFLIAIALGVLTGGVICWIAGRSWMPKVALLDAITALASGFTMALVVTFIIDRYYYADSLVGALFIVSVVGVVIRHIISRRWAK